MNITKRQSFLIAGGAIGHFIVVGVIFLKDDAKSLRITEQHVEIAAEPTLSPPPPLITSAQATSAGQATSSEGPAASGVFTMNEFHRSEVQDGRKLWEVHGLQAQLFPETNSVRISNAELSMFQKSGKETQLTTKQATLYMNGPTLTKAHLEGGVQVVYNHEFTLTSEKADCDRVANTVLIPTPVKISSDAMEITGQRLEGSVDSQVFTISGDVVTLIKPGAKKPAEIK